MTYHGASVFSRFMTVGMLLVAAVFALGPATALAQAGDCSGGLQVQAGDTWESLAEACGVSVPELRMQNPDLWAKQGATLNPGDSIAVPSNNAPNNNDGTADAAAPVQPQSQPVEEQPGRAGSAKPAEVASTLMQTASDLPFVGAIHAEPYTVEDPNAYVFTVRMGEYWILIASKFGISYEALRAENEGLWQLRGVLIRPGDQMSIPGLTAEDMIPPVAYVVVSGDSWYRIADLFFVSFWHLRLDNLSLWARRGVYIQPGDQMVITYLPSQFENLGEVPSPADISKSAEREESSDGEDAASAPQVVPSTAEDTPIRFTDPPEGAEIYIVRPGDSWFSIASEIGITFESLRSINRRLWELRGQDIRPGDEMIIPPHGTPPPPPEIKTTPGDKDQDEGESEEEQEQPDEGKTIPSGDYVVQPGDTWESIANAAGIDIQGLEDANVDMAGKELQPGQVLLIP